MRIGIDIDGTITDFQLWILTYGKYFNNFVLRKTDIANINRYHPKDIFQWSDSEYEAFIEFITTNFRNLIPPRPFAVDCINMLASQHNEIYIISSRKMGELEEPLQETTRWLNKYRIKFDKLFVGDSDKRRICVENGIELFIDDKIKQCQEVSAEGIRTIIFDNLYNKNCKEIERVYDFFDVYQVINKYNSIE